MVLRKRPDVVDRTTPAKRKKSPPGNLKAKQFRHELILDKVASLYVKNYTLAEIGKQFNPPVTAKTACLWVKEVRERWLKQQVNNFDERKAVELEKLDRLEEEAWKAWEASKKDAETKKKVVTKALRKSDDDEEGTLKVVGTVNDKTAKGQVGNPAFLAQIERIVDMRCRIFGVTKPADVNLTQNNNTMNVVAPSWDALFGQPEGPDPVMAKLQEVERLPALREAVLVEDRG